jgi:hypothetical protein
VSKTGAELAHALGDGLELLHGFFDDGLHCFDLVYQTCGLTGQGRGGIHVSPEIYLLNACKGSGSINPASWMRAVKSAFKARMHGEDLVLSI